ncbi:hypothetical protein OW763_03200 [Clostridium aestuarii]|uniref:Uncharacterized protein n=1 Tax=Clostridium aestuarii TaxID=338193 RepID=A0ABT4CWJ8_9CLOT|nr:hypothetical protein [Clostridium aestuarii]MCY6483363.1 hypothetical protein [Clostridium aestuarii]
MVFINRKVYETKIGKFLFKANETTGRIEVFNNNNCLIDYINRVPDSYNEFEIMAHDLYNKIEGLH